MDTLPQDTLKLCLASLEAWTIARVASVSRQFHAAGDEFASEAAELVLSSSTASSSASRLPAGETALRWLEIRQAGLALFAQATPRHRAQPPGFGAGAGDGDAAGVGFVEVQTVSLFVVCWEE
jgi:hypothetical protein